jgi:hypothetical protein
MRQLALDIPRAAWGIWVGDTWRLNNELTLNLGVRYDMDWGASAPPLVRETDVPIDNGLFSENVGYRTDIRDLNNWSPRVGFNYDVSGNGQLVFRGGTGWYYSVPVSNATFDQQLFNGQRVLANTFTNDGRPGWVLDPQHGRTGEDFLSGRAPLPPQAVTVFAHDYQLPTILQSMAGFAKQLGVVMAFDADLTHYKGYIGSSRDPNLFHDPSTGYNRHPNRGGRPRPDYGRITLYESKGRADNLMLATSFTRRYKDNWQAGLTYTYMFFRNDTGTSTSGYSNSNRNNFFDISLDGEWARALDFQRSTLRLNGIYNLPHDFTLAGAYFYGSGNYFFSSYPWDPFGSGAGIRLRPDGSMIERNNLKGKPIHKVDLRVTREIALGYGVKIAGIAEVFNLLNTKNFGNYTTVETRSNYGKPVQHLGTMFVPRSG